MEGLLKLFYVILVYVSAFTLFFAPFGLIFSSFCLKTVHFNLRVLTFILGVLWCTFPIGGFLFVLVLNAEENPPLIYDRIDYLFARNICAMSGYAFRVIETFISFERLLATVYFKTYESHKIFRIYSIFATLISILICVFFSVLFNVLHAPAIVIYIFLITVETTNFVLLFILRKQNHKLRQMSNSNNALLTSKYQLIENIKSLNLLFPQVIISFILSNCALAMTLALRTFNSETLISYNPPLYYTIYNINVIIVSLYWIKQSSWFKIKVIQLRKFCSNRFNESTEIVVLKATTVKTALGKTVQAKQNIDEYFNGLKNVWN